MALMSSAFLLLYTQEGKVMAYARSRVDGIVGRKTGTRVISKYMRLPGKFPDGLKKW